MRRLVTGGHAGPAGSQQPEPEWSHGCTGWWCPCRWWSGAKRLPLWGSCLRSRLKRSPYVGFAPLSWQRREAQRLGRTSSVLPLCGNPPSPSGEGFGGRKPLSRSPGVGWSFCGAELHWIHPWGLVLSIHAALGDRGPRWPSRIAAARTRMEPPMYRIAVPLPPVDRKSTRLNSSHRIASRMPSSA